MNPSPSTTSLRRVLLLVLPLVLCGTKAWGQATRPAEPAGQVIFDMDTVRHHPGEITTKDKQKVPCGTAEAVDGKFGKAVRFTFVEGASGGLMTAGVRATADWDKADGFSFWVKGDGSDSWGGIEVVDRDNFALRYGYCFPIDSTEWRKIVVPWRDLTPELAGPLMDPTASKAAAAPKDAPAPKDAKAAGYAPSGFGNFWFGKWFYWRDYPAESYAIDQVAVEPHIDAERAPAVEPGLRRVRAKLKEHKPITIVTMGDSLTDKRHWANRTVLWSELLAKDLKAKYGGDVTLVNPAVGGTTLSQNLVTMPKWGKQAPSPDLVVVWFGGNDWDNGVRGERFAQYLRLAVDRIRRQTRGAADVLLMTTDPTHARWDTMAELEQAVRAAAKEKQTGLADVAAECRKAGSADEALRREYWAWDKVHLGPKGHEAARDVVLRAVEAAD